jgi:helicase required for RNAi-mediated heterochromatin assembly 1
LKLPDIPLERCRSSAMKGKTLDQSRTIVRLTKRYSFPLSEEICTLSTDIATPSYVSSRPSINLRAAFNGSDRQSTMQHANILESWPPAPEEHLDKSQWAALQQILTKRVALIQGPPGTGKTYVSKIALQVLIENREKEDPPIIVAAQTNHALDQLLGHVAKFDPEYIRLGGRSTKPEVRERALYEVRQRERLPIAPGGLLEKASKQIKILARQMVESLSPFDRTEARSPLSAATLYELGVLTQAQASSLDAGAAQWVTAGSAESENSMALWLNKALLPFQVVYKQDNFGFSEEEVDLEYEQVTELQAEMGVTDDEDVESLRGPWCTVEDNFTVSKPSPALLRIAQKTLSEASDLWKVKENVRGPIYSILQAEAKAKILAKFRELATAYQILVRDLKVGKWERDAQYLERANIIGMTTTGLSKYRPLVSSLKPKIVVIEEAAEVIEAPVTAACVESLEHLILVGDHQQLQGHCNVQELGVTPYNLNVSMFERLVRNDMPFKILLRQRRMDPEFRRLLYPIYPQLQDHPNVVGRPALPVGLGNLKSFFFNHDYPEYKDGQLSSFNDREAEFIAGFYYYLLQNGAEPQWITILTFYNGQRKRILHHLKSRPQTAHHYTNVVTVDSYQGEENRIIILSLVRNNEHDEIGFLKVDNRVCVALSRAKHGFYIFGNSKLLAASSWLWSRVIDIMANNPNRVGDKFPIVCKKHGRQTLIIYPGDWQLSDGGCDAKCSENLPCGHPCALKCHPYAHDSMACQQPCERILLCGHKCVKVCFENPCFCSCDQSAVGTRISDEGPPSASQSRDNQQETLGKESSGNPWTDMRLVGGGPRSKRADTKEVRGNNSQVCNGGILLPSKNYSPLPHRSQGASSGDGASAKASTAMSMKSPPIQPGVSGHRNSPTTSGNSLCASLTLNDLTFRPGKGPQHSPEKQTEMLTHWTTDAAGRVKNDDNQRQKISAAEVEFAVQQRPEEVSLIEFEDLIDCAGWNPLNIETVVETKNERKEWAQQFQPANNAKYGYGTTPGMGSSTSGQSNGQHSLEDLLC